MDNFQLGIVTGLIVAFVLISYFIYSFRKYKRTQEDLMKDIIKKIEDDRNGLE